MHTVNSYHVVGLATVENVLSVTRAVLVDDVEDQVDQWVDSRL